MKYDNLRQAKADNSQKPCGVPGCTKHRHGISKWCSTHKYAADTWGHPLARTIASRELATEEAAVRRLIDLNTEHQGIAYAVNFLDTLLLAAAQGTTHAPAGDRLAALYNAGLTGKELLVRVAAVYLCREGHRRLILSDRHFGAVVGHAILRACQLPRHERIYGGQRRSVGKYVIDHIGTLALNIAKTATQVELQRNQRLNEMAKPLLLG